MARKWVAGLLLFLAACTTVPLNNQIAGAADVVNLHAQRTKVLFEAGAIDINEAQAQMNYINQAAGGIRTARSALSTCHAKGMADCPASATALSAVTAILAQVDQFLIAKSVKEIK